MKRSTKGEFLKGDSASSEGRGANSSSLKNGDFFFLPRFKIFFSLWNVRNIWCFRPLKFRFERSEHGAVITGTSRSLLPHHGANLLEGRIPDSSQKNAPGKSNTGAVTRNFLLLSGTAAAIWDWRQAEMQNNPNFG